MDLIITIERKRIKLKLPLQTKRKVLEAGAIANMLRHVADNIDQNIKIYESREAFWKEHRGKTGV